MTATCWLDDDGDVGVVAFRCTAELSLRCRLFGRRLLLLIATVMCATLLGVALWVVVRRHWRRWLRHLRHAALGRLFECLRRQRNRWLLSSSSLLSPSRRQTRRRLRRRPIRQRRSRQHQRPPQHRCCWHCRCRSMWSSLAHAAHRHASVG